MAYSAQEVAAFIAANPQLSPDEILSLAQSNGVGADVLFQALNTEGSRFQGASYDDVANAYQAAPVAAVAPAAPVAPAGTQNATVASTGTQQQVQANTPATVTRASSTGTAATGAGTAYIPGQITDQQLIDYFAANPGRSDSENFAQLRQYQVSPEQVSRALGIPLDQAQNRFREQRLNATPTGLIGSEEALEKGLADATGTLRGAETTSISDIDAALQRMVDLYGLNIDDLRAAGTTASTYFQPYQQGGTTAFNTQLALSGALGQDAFNQARVESPYEKFLFEQGMRGNLAGAAATGGLGGGNVQRELTRFGQGMASQGLQQQIGNLNTLSGYGMQAAGALGDITMNTAGNIAGQRTNQASAQGTAGLNRANIRQNTGQNIADMQYGTGQDLASGRTRAGEIQANQLENFYANQSNLLSGLGTYRANMIDRQASDLIDMGGDAATRASNLATGLSRDVSGLQTGLARDQIAAYGGAERINSPSFDYEEALGSAAGGYMLGNDIIYQQRQGGLAPVSESRGVSTRRTGPYDDRGGYRFPDNNPFNVPNFRSFGP
jgi:hypothetical protein